jgi:hypothetical protein
MPESKRHLERRLKVKALVQTVYSEPRRILTGTRITAKGKELMKKGTLTRYYAKKKYGKNVYKDNPKAMPIKVIHHRRITKA